MLFFNQQTVPQSSIEQEDKLKIIAHDPRKKQFLELFVDLALKAQDRGKFYVFILMAITGFVMDFRLWYVALDCFILAGKVRSAVCQLIS